MINLLWLLLILYLIGALPAGPWWGGQCPYGYGFYGGGGGLFLLMIVLILLAGRNGP